MSKLYFLVHSVLWTIACLFVVFWMLYFFWRLYFSASDYHYHGIFQLFLIQRCFIEKNSQCRWTYLVFRKVQVVFFKLMDVVFNKGLTFLWVRTVFSFASICFFIRKKHTSSRKKMCTRFAAASDKVYQLLAHDRWFSPGTPASSTTKTGRHDIAEILLKVALNTKNQSINHQEKMRKKKLSRSFSSSTESHWTIQNLVSILDHIYHSALEIRDTRYR